MNEITQKKITDELAYWFVEYGNGRNEDMETFGMYLERKYDIFKKYNIYIFHETNIVSIYNNVKSRVKNV